MNQYTDSPNSNVSKARIKHSKKILQNPRPTKRKLVSLLALSLCLSGTAWSETAYMGETDAYWLWMEYGFNTDGTCMAGDAISPDLPYQPNKITLWGMEVEQCSSERPVCLTCDYLKVYGHNVMTETDYIGTDPLLKIERTYRNNRFGSGWSMPYQNRLITKDYQNINANNSEHFVYGPYWKKTWFDPIYAGYFDASGDTYDEKFVEHLNSSHNPWNYRSVRLLRANGQSAIFVSYNNGPWIGPTNATGKLSGSGSTEDGTASFTFTSNEGLVETYGADGKLVAMSDNLGHAVTLTYDIFGRLERVTNKESLSITFGYKGLTAQHTSSVAPGNKEYLYTHKSTPIVDYSEYRYAMTGVTRLEEQHNYETVTHPDQMIKQYYYGEPGLMPGTLDAGALEILKRSDVANAVLLTGISYGGLRYRSFQYNSKGQLIMKNGGDANSDIGKYLYNYSTNSAGNPIVLITDPLKKVRTFQVGNSDLGASDIYCPECSKDKKFDERDNVSWEKDFNDNVTSYNYETSRNLETVRVEGLPSSTSSDPTNWANYKPAAGTAQRKFTTEWHSTLAKPSKIAEPLLITSYSYNPNGTVLTETVQATKDTNGGDAFAAVADGAARTTTYTYHTSGAAIDKIKTINGPRTDVTDTSTYGYDSLGRLASITNAAGHVTSFSNYDTQGNPQTITDPNGLVITLSYNNRNRLESVKRGNETTSYQYNAHGSITNVTLPNGNSITYGYDNANRLTSIKDKSNNAIVYTLDAMGNRTKEEVKDSAGVVVQVHSRVFNSLNQLWKDIGAVNNATTEYGYDDNGNLKNITDPLTRKTTHGYDALNRLTSTIDPAITTGATAGTTQYVYNGQDQLTSVIDPRNLATQYTFNGHGETTEQNSPDTGKTSYTYDSAGNLKTRTDAKGQLTSYTYDALNRMTRAEYKSSASVITLVMSYAYDSGTYGKGRLTSVSETTYTGGTSTTLGTATAASTSYSYSQAGRLISETRNQNGVAYTTRYTYETTGSGRLASLTYPSGRILSYSYDTQGRISQMSTTYGSITSVIASNIAYFPFGGVKSFTYGDGATQPVQSYSRSINANGLLSSYTLGKQNASGVNKGNQYSINYDNADQLQTISYTNLSNNSLLGTDTFAYNGLGHLTSASGSASHTFAYDTVGNRTSKTVGTSSTSYSYPGTSNRLASSTTGAVTTSMTHDANGALTKDLTRSSYSYDARGRLVSTVTAAGTLTYLIDAQGRRVRKQGAGNDTLYHYNQQGQLIAESKTGSSNVQKEYVYLEDLPIAVMQ